MAFIELEHLNRLALRFDEGPSALTFWGHLLYTWARGCFVFCPPFQVKYTTIVPAFPSHASIPTTSSSQLPVGGLNSVSLTPAGGVDDAGWLPFFRPFFARVPLMADAAPVPARPLFFPLPPAAFFSCHWLIMRSLPPTLVR